MQVRLSNCEVDIIDKLTWGQAQQIEQAIVAGAKLGSSGLTGYDGSALLEAKYKALEVCVKEIREGEDKKQFSREWMNNLSVEDGNTLYEAVDLLTKKK